MIEDFGVPEHIAHFIIAIEKGETHGCIEIVQDPDTDLEVVPEADIIDL